MLMAVFSFYPNGLYIPAIYPVQREGLGAVFRFYPNGLHIPAIYPVQREGLGAVFSYGIGADSEEPEAKKSPLYRSGLLTFRSERVRSLQ